MIQLGAVGSPVVYVAPLLLALTGDGDLRPVNRAGERLYALHSCDCGKHGWYRCVTLEHLRWGTQTENEQDKLERVAREVVGRSITDRLRAEVAL